MHELAEKPDLRGLRREQVQALLADWGQPGFRAGQVFSWVQQKGVTAVDQMTNLPLSLRRHLAEETTLTVPKVLRRQVAAAGDTAKLLLELADGEQIEMALMLYRRKDSRDRATCCVSSQSGCAMNCAFCATGAFRSFRNLTAGEIVAQAQLADAFARELGFAGLTNVVFMGMGEPLYNLEQVAQALALLNDPDGMNIGHRRITVSTCGIVPQIYALSQWPQPVELAVSLHSADEALRKQLMPGAAHWSLAQLMEACRDYRRQTGRRITFEYALFDGVNDSPAMARLLADLLTGEDILVNIIPANSVGKAEFRPSPPQSIEKFIAVCQKNKINYQFREPRGRDIDAACGQLRKHANG